MVVLMVYHLTGGSWGLLIRRILEAAMKTLPLLAVLFLPIACGIGYLYPWAQPDAVAASPKLQYQQFYLQPTYFWIRAAVYFAALAGDRLSAELAGRARKIETGNPRLAWKSLQAQRLRRGGLRHQPPFRGGRLGHVAPAGVPFDHLGADCSPSGQLLSAFCFALIVLALADRPAAAGRGGVAEGAQRPGQPAADAPDPLGVHGLVPVHAGLDRQFAGRRRLVSAARRASAGRR